jgi:hypothetical protein
MPSGKTCSSLVLAMSLRLRSVYGHLLCVFKFQKIVGPAISVSNMASPVAPDPEKLDKFLEQGGEFFSWNKGKNTPNILL